MGATRRRLHLHRPALRPQPRHARAVRRAAALRQHRADQPRAGEGAARLRRRAATASSPIHCASFCFLNSPKITALTGAQFKSHGTGDVQGDASSKPNHPIMKGLQAHRELGRDLRPRDAQRAGPHRPVLPRRGRASAGAVHLGAHARARAACSTPPGATTSGRGATRISRTCSSAASAGRAGDWALAAAAASCKPFEYVRGQHPELPRRRAVGHDRRRRSSRCRSRSSPEESMQHMVMPPGFEAEAVRVRAGHQEADLHGLGRARPALGRRDDRLPQRHAARRARAATRSRSARTPTATARPTSSPSSPTSSRIPTSLCFANGGADRHAGAGHAVPEGHRRRRQGRRAQGAVHRLGHADTHAGPSNLRYGFDNWVYGVVRLLRLPRHRRRQARLASGRACSASSPTARSWSSSARPTTTPGAWASARTTRSSARPPTATPASTCPSPTATTSRSQGLRAQRAGRRSPTPTASSRSPSRSGRWTSTAATPPAPATRSTPPAASRRNTGTSVAFVCRADRPPGRPVPIMRPTAAASRPATSSASSPATTSGPRRSRPTSAPTGACGCIDWYNIIVQHNPIPPGFKSGKGDAYVTPLRDKRHGRVYRLVWTKAASRRKAIDLSKASPRAARRSAQERQHALAHARPATAGRDRGNDRDVMPALLALVADTSVDATRTQPRRHPRPLDGARLGDVQRGRRPAKPPSAATAALTATRRRRRRARRRSTCLPRTPKSVETMLVRKLIGDPTRTSARRRCWQLAEMPASDGGRRARSRSLGQDRANDRGLPTPPPSRRRSMTRGFLKAAFRGVPVRRTRSRKRLPAASTGGQPDPQSVVRRGHRATSRWPGRSAPTAAARRTTGSTAATGHKCLRIQSASVLTSSWFTDVQRRARHRVSPVRAGSRPRASAARWEACSTSTAPSSARNAVTARPPTGGRWRSTINSGDRSVVSINCLFGGWGQAAGPRV